MNDSTNGFLLFMSARFWMIEKKVLSIGFKSLACTVTARNGAKQEEDIFENNRKKKTTTSNRKESK